MGMSSLSFSGSFVEAGMTLYLYIIFSICLINHSRLFLCSFVFADRNCRNMFLYALSFSIFHFLSRLISIIKSIIFVHIGQDALKFRKHLVFISSMVLFLAFRSRSFLLPCSNGLFRVLSSTVGWIMPPHMKFQISFVSLCSISRGIL